MGVLGSCRTVGGRAGYNDRNCLDVVWMATRPSCQGHGRGNHAEICFQYLLKFLLLILLPNHRQNPHRPVPRESSPRIVRSSLSTVAVAPEPVAESAE